MTWMDFMKRPLEFSCDETEEAQSSYKMKKSTKIKFNCNCLLFGLFQISMDILANIVTKTVISFQEQMNYNSGQRYNYFSYASNIFLTNYKNVTKYFVIISFGPISLENNLIVTVILLGL